ncbi:MAG: rRNA maturation RNase YbeY [Tannerella sp.]|jgi:rRNA maturation RNase YbeY|nr:rRNA maturation RNase YbeY [Tannerella sp.]
MAIHFYAENIEQPLLQKRKVTQWIKDIASAHGKSAGEISYQFCSDEKILEINRQYLQHDYYTDIITFDYTEGNVLSGDLFISLDTVRSNSEQFQTDYKEELYRVIIHGVLHLCGINDQSPEEQAKMTDEENKALALLQQRLTGEGSR